MDTEIALEFGQCAGNMGEVVILLGFLTLVAIIGLFGISKGIPMYPAGAGFIFLFAILIVWGCGALFGWMFFIFGMLFLISAVSMR